MAAGGRGGGPGIVVRGEGGAALDGGVVEGPEDDERIGMGVFEPCLAKLLEGGDGGRLRVRDDAVKRFLGVDVGLMLEGAADGVADGFAEDFQQDESEQDDDQAGEAVEGLDAPAMAAKTEKTVSEQKGEPEEGERSEDAEGESPEEMVEDVMAALVGEDEEDFVGGHAVGGGVPDDDALGGAEAADVGVEAVDFDAGAHEKHALGRDGCAGARDDALELADEFRMGGGERLEVVEKRLDELGQDKRGGQDDGDGSKPEPEPGAARRTGKEPAGKDENGRADEKHEQGGERLVAKPCGPALDADAGTEKSAVADGVCGQQDAEVEQEQKTDGKERGLKPETRAESLDEVGKTLGKAAFEQEDEHGDSAEFDAEVEAEAKMGKMPGERGL